MFPVYIIDTLKTELKTSSLLFTSILLDVVIKMQLFNYSTYPVFYEKYNNVHWILLN